MIVFLKYESVKDNFMKYKCLSCNKNYSNKIDEELEKRFKNTFKFSNNDINKFILLLRKGVYPYECMDEWKKFKNVSLPVKEEFYSNLNMEDITDADYMHAKRVCKDLEIKNLGEYHDLYFKSDTLLLADVFKNFRKICLNYHLDPASFLLALGLAWQAALKKTEVKSGLLTDIDILLMADKGIRGRIFHTIHQYAKANNKYTKDYDENKESSYRKYWDVNYFAWIEDTSQFNEDLIKSYNEKSDEGSFLEVDVQYPEKINENHNDLPFLPERMKMEKFDEFVTNLHDKTEYVTHIRNLKQALNDGLVLKEDHRVIKFYQNVWLKPYIDMNTKLRKIAKNNFEKDSFKLMNNEVWGKTMENMRKHRNIKHVTTEKRRNYLVSGPNYHATKFFTKNLLAIEMRKTQILMNKPVYLGL